MIEGRSWLQAYPPGVVRTLEPYPRVSVFTMLERSAWRFPDSVALAWFGRHRPEPVPAHAEVSPQLGQGMRLGRRAAAPGRGPPLRADHPRRQAGGGLRLTEAAPLTHANPVNGLAKPGTIGPPVPDTDCRIIDLRDPDKEAPPGDRGELCIRRPRAPATRPIGYGIRPPTRPLETGTKCPSSHAANG